MVGKTQPSRKGKKAWRKNVDIKQVEEQLDEIRAEERMDGAQIHKQKNDALFIIDKKGNEKNKQSLKCRPLRIDQVIDMKSGIPGITSRIHPTSSALKTVTLDNGKVRKVSKATLQSVEKIVKTKQQHKQAHEESVTDKKKKRVVEAFKEGKAMDIWGSNSVRGTSSNTDNIDGNDYLEPVKPIIVKKPKLPVVSKKHVAAINPAAAGTSYNPSFKDHQDILQKALDEENRVETRKSNIQQRLAYPAELEELDEEMDFDGSDDEKEEEDGDNSEEIEKDAPMSANPSTADAARKSKVERNKELRRLKREREEQGELEQRKVLKQISSLSHIEREVKLSEKKAKNLKLKKDTQKKNKTAASMRLGPHKFAPNPLALDVQLTEDLPESLRELKPEGNIFTDRFKSMQARGLLEPRLPVGKRRRYKEKSVEVHSYKRFQ